MIVNVKRLDELAKLPSKSHEDDACYDIVATSKKDLGDGRIEYGLGLALQPVDSFKNVQFDLRSRSSIHKTGMVLSNGIGTGDMGYLGQYKAVFYKVIPTLPDYEVGDRILQLQVTSSESVEFVEVDELKETVRGTGGFGSTGR